MLFKCWVSRRTTYNLLLVLSDRWKRPLGSQKILSQRNLWSPQWICPLPPQAHLPGHSKQMTAVNHSQVTGFVLPSSLRYGSSGFSLSSSQLCIWDCDWKSPLDCGRMYLWPTPAHNHVLSLGNLSFLDFCYHPSQHHGCWLTCSRGSLSFPSVAAWLSSSSSTSLEASRSSCWRSCVWPLCCHFPAPALIYAYHESDRAPCRLSWVGLHPLHCTGWTDCPAAILWAWQPDNFYCDVPQLDQVGLHRHLS